MNNIPIKNMTMDEIEKLPALECQFRFTRENNIDQYTLQVILDQFVKSKPIDLGASMSLIALNQRWTTRPKPGEKRNFKLYARCTKGLTKAPGKSGTREWFYRIELYLNRTGDKTTTLSAFLYAKDFPYIQSTTLDDLFIQIGDIPFDDKSKVKNYA